MPGNNMYVCSNSRNFALFCFKNNNKLYIATAQYNLLFQYFLVFLLWIFTVVNIHSKNKNTMVVYGYIVLYFTVGQFGRRSSYLYLYLLILCDIASKADCSNYTTIEKQLIKVSKDLRFRKQIRKQQKQMIYKNK